MNRRTGPGRVPFAENPGGVGAKRVSIFSASFAGKDFVTRGEESGTNRPAGGTSCALRKWLNVRNLARIKSVYVYVQNRMSKQAREQRRWRWKTGHTVFVCFTFF